jgi:aspartate aminotransferase
MKISERIQNVPPSPMRKLTPFALAAKANGKKVYHLNIGQPDVDTPPTFFQAVKNYDAKVLSYGVSQGDPNLIKAICEYYKRWHIDYKPENVFITNGGSEAVGFAIMTLCDPGDNILMFEPFYANYQSYVKEYGAKIVAVPTTAENGYHVPDAATIEKYVTPRTKGILLSNPGNPTGVIYTKKEMDEIAKVVLKYDLALISDEVYREFVYDGEYTSFGTMTELDNNLIMIDSVSKRFSACGARIGTIISKNKDLAMPFLKCCQARLCCPALEQIGATALYSTPASYFKAVNDEYKKRRDTIKAELAKIPGIVSSDPKGAFYVMAKLPVDNAEKFAKWMLTDFENNGETVMITPGYGFYATQGKGLQEVRLAYVINCQALTRAIQLLGEGIKAVQQ